MKTPNRQSSILITLLTLLLGILGWWFLAPTQVGGGVTYVIVDGNSMEPDFHFGDLVLVRKEATYQVGDAVTYENKDMGRFVFHRIIATDLDRFILKGDHNTWVDSFHPSRDEIIGRLWVHIPKLGKAISWVRLPINLAITVGLLGGILMFDMLAKNPQEKEKIKPSRVFWGVGISEEFAYLMGFLTLGFLILGIFSFTRPLTRAADNIIYTQDGNFFYSATGTPGIYDTDLVRSGEPVFPNLTCFLNIGFTYKLLGAEAQNISGAHQMYARVMDTQSGWQRTIPLTEAIPFASNSFFAVAPLDLCQVASLVNLVEEETGLHPNTYTLEVVNHTEFIANIGDKPVKDVFDPTLTFKFDRAHIYLAAPTNGETQNDLLHSSKKGMAGNSDMQPNTFSVFGWKFTVWNLRLISLLGFAVSSAGLFIAGMNIYNMAQESQSSLIKLKYGSMLVDVYETNLEPTSRLIDVTSIEDLARLAERQGTMILHMTLNFLHYYLVQNNGTTYRYVVSTGKKGVPANEQDHSKTPVISTAIIKDDTPPPIQLPLPAKPKHWMTGNRKNINRLKPVPVEPAKPSMQPANHYYENYFAENKQPIIEETVSYAIRTGEIEFYMPSSNTEMLKKIKL